MDEHRAALASAVPLQTLLGHVNFAEGKPDPRFARQISDAFAVLVLRGVAQPWQALHEILVAELDVLHQTQAAFRDVEQARAVLHLLFVGVLPAYRSHHADLLFHQTEADLFQPFFLARVFEAVLVQRGPWQEQERIVAGALRQLNDYVGHRPIAILETRPRGEPYDHERIHPIPLFIKGAGVAWGRYQAIVEQALDILLAADPEICQDACFDPDLLDELALDPRGYDFNHPADKRPNYVFGEWDPHHVDNQGRFRRYVVRQIVLDGLLQRVVTGGVVSGEWSAAPLAGFQSSFTTQQAELLREAAAVLAGTILMATGVSGLGPETHDSSTTLSTLVPHIARYREAFYTNLIEIMDQGHAARLREEAALTRQPFGAARQHLNQYLARQRAWQLQQRHLSLLFAQIGYPEASRRQAAVIPVASMRLVTEMHLRLTLGRLHLERGAVAKAAALLPEIESLLQRGIACGAVVDPWNILGFQGQYPRFRALEDSVRDQRIDELVHVVGQVLNLYAEVLSEGAARGTLSDTADLRRNLRRLADWWDAFATVEVSDVPRVYGKESADSAEHVALALSRWHERGAAAADLGFWREHQEGFNSPKAFALVVDALLHKADYRAAMALLMTWLGQAESVPLEDGHYSFHQLALRWMLGVCGPATGPPARQEVVGKFFDYLEANAEDYWQVPGLDTLGTGDAGPNNSAPVAPADSDLYEAAYEDVTYRDSSDDDVEAEVLDFMPQKDFDLTAEAERLEKRLRFLATLARLWTIATRSMRSASPAPVAVPPDFAARFVDWTARAARSNYRSLLSLLDAIHSHEIPKPGGSYDGLVEFDRRRLLKERLLGLIIATCLDTVMAHGALRGASGAPSEPLGVVQPEWEPVALRLEQAFWRGDAGEARALLPAFLQAFAEEPLLFRPLAQDGHPAQVLRTSLAQNMLRGLVFNLPRLGLIRETFQVVKTAFDMEQRQTIDGPRVTGFERLIHAACQATVETVLDAGARKAESAAAPETDGERLAALLETIVEPYLALWIEHSKTLRLAVLEGVTGEEGWKALCDFIGRYGHDIFQARFMALGNLRGILHRGAGAYLDYLQANPDPLHPIRLIDELDRDVTRPHAERLLEVILQTVIENYEEYRDYNATTTQSDYGENLHQFFEFLRLKASYERNAWQLRPLNLVHEMLARRHPAAAAFWREQIKELTREMADEHMHELGRLEKTHGMHLRTIADRFEQRFVQPMEIDRLCALVEPAMDQARQLAAETSLEEELRPLAANPSGAGLDVPNWLERLRSEVQRVRHARSDLARLAEDLYPVPKVPVTLEDLRAQLKDWNKLMPG